MLRALLLSSAILLVVGQFALASDNLRPKVAVEAPDLCDALLRPSVFGHQVRAAIQEVQSHRLTPADRIDRLEDMFTVISRSSHGQWQFRRVRGSDGSTLFVGPEGPAVVVDQAGRVFKGIVDMDAFDKKVWAADYSTLQEIPLIKKPKID